MLILRCVKVAGEKNIWGFFILRCIIMTGEIDMNIRCIYLFILCIASYNLLHFCLGIDARMDSVHYSGLHDK